MRLAIRLLLVLLLTAAVGALWVHALGGAATDWHGIGATLSAAPWPLLAGSAACQMLSVLVRSLRWRVLLTATGDAERDEVPALRTLFSATGIGFAVSFLLPLRLGEVIRPALVSARSSVPFGKAAASVVLERLLDMATVLALLYAFLWAEPGRTPAALREKAWWLGLALAVVGAGAILLHRFHRAALEAAIRGVAARLPGRARPLAEKLGVTFLTGCDVLTVRGSWWRLPLWSLANWGTPLVAIYLALRATGAAPNPAVALLILPLTALGVAVPTPGGGLGAYQTVVTWGLVHAYGLPATVAGAAAIAAWMTCVPPVILLGLFLLWRDGLSPGGLKSVVAEAQVPAGRPAGETTA